MPTSNRTCILTAPPSYNPIRPAATRCWARCSVRRTTAACCACSSSSTTSASGRSWAETRSGRRRAIGGAGGGWGGVHAVGPVGWTRMALPSLVWMGSDGPCGPHAAAWRSAGWALSPQVPAEAVPRLFVPPGEGVGGRPAPGAAACTLGLTPHAGSREHCVCSVACVQLPTDQPSVPTCPGGRGGRPHAGLGPGGGGAQQGGRRRA